MRGTTEKDCRSEVDRGAARSRGVEAAVLARRYDRASWEAWPLGAIFEVIVPLRGPVNRHARARGNSAQPLLPGPLPRLYFQQVPNTVYRFDIDTIKQIAFPAVARGGRELFEKGAVRSLQFLRNDIVATVHDECELSVVIALRQPPQYTCSCGFAYGGACVHVIAAMHAANTTDSVQVGIDFDDSVEPPGIAAEQKHLSPPPAPPADVRTIASAPVGRLYLDESTGLLLVELRFGYGDGLCEFPARVFDTAKLVTRDSGEVVRVKRSRAREDRLVEILEQHEVCLYRRGVYTPDGESTDWLRDMLPRLAHAGFEIYGRELLRTHQLREAQPALSMSVSADGATLQVTVETSFEGVPATLVSVFDAVMDGNRYVKLTDGSTGVLPQEWLERFAELLALCRQKPTGNTLELQPSQVRALDLLDAITDQTTWNEAASTMLRRAQEPPATASVPESFTGTLRPYQQAGYEWLSAIGHLGLGGCLADDMGLGKTVQTLALLAAEKERRSPVRTALLVVPTSLLFNWAREAHRFAPRLVVVQYHGQARKRYSVRDLDLADLVITTYGTVNRDIEQLKRVLFNYVILDEAQAIKNPLSRTSKSIRMLRARHRIALSGTPIENNLAELWSLFAFVNPGMLGTYRRFVAQYGLPIERDRNEVRAMALRRLIAPCVLRRTKEQVASDLPPKTETVVYCSMTPQQQTLYEVTRDAYRGRIMRELDEHGMEQSRMRILEGLLRLRQICCHPLLMDQTFHGESGKFTMLDDSIDDVIGGGHKVLIFSQFVAALELLGRRLSKRGIAYEVLTGKTVDRQRPVDRFQSDKDIPVMLISLKAGGTGLNLTAADYVVHLDPWWNPAAESQASARAHRIGQTKPVFVYKLVTEQSVEERVVELQERKKELFDTIITTEESVFKRLGRGDIERLFG
ncbi:MAG: hypothetical protein GF331_01400 [Chitinivibrionales bacterium]|nr:hypothetical protein [Chitinivibrionales bacterium]